MLEIDTPHPGDGVILARLSLESEDGLLRQCGINFLADRLKSAKFIVAELRLFRNAAIRGKVSPQLKDRYITQILAPAMENDPTFWTEHTGGTREEAVPGLIRKIVRLGHDLGGQFPKLLVPLIKSLVDTTSLLLIFLDEALEFPNWTQQEVLVQLSSSVILPTIQKLQFNNQRGETKQGYAISTEELKRLMSHLSPPGNPDKCKVLQVSYNTLLAVMANMETLDLAEV